MENPQKTRQLAQSYTKRHCPPDNAGPRSHLGTIVALEVDLRTAKSMRSQRGSLCRIATLQQKPLLLLGFLHRGERCHAHE